MQDDCDVQTSASHFSRPQISGEYDLGKLPAELAQEVIARVGSTSDLYNLCLVCRNFNQWATPQLYRSVFLSSVEHMHRFSVLLARLPNLGCVVRELWMFQSVMLSDDEWGETDGSRMPSDDDESIGSSCEGSSPGEPTKDMGIDSDIDDINVPVHGSGERVFPREEIPRMRPTTIPSSSHPNTSFYVVKAWANSLSPIVTPNSIVYALGCVILSACHSLESLNLPWPTDEYSSSCLHALSPHTRLRELMIYDACDLLDAGFSYPLNFRNASNVRRLTILNTMFHQHYVKIPEIFPHLTHLRITLQLFSNMASYLSRFKALTHLWFAPPEGDWGNRDDLGYLFPDLHVQCPNIKWVRVDVPSGSYNAVENSVPMQDTNSMRIFAVEVPFNNCSFRDDGPYRYDPYTECLEYYWTLRLTGGGWDD